MAETALALWMALMTAEALVEALKTALISQLALALILWLSSLGNGYLTLSDSASQEDSSVRPQPEVGRLVVVEAPTWSLEQGSLLGLSCGLTETRT